MSSNINPQPYIHRSLFLLTLLAFSVLTVPHLFTKGLFMDGLIYASISRNLAEGYGTFWDPSFSNTLLATFHEHPPVALGLESLVFRLIGDLGYNEKLYSLFTGILTAAIIALIFRRVSVNRKMFWLPILLWISTERVFWSINNNMLENTMSLFSLSAIYVLILSIEKNLPGKLLLIFAAAVLVGLSFLSKGLPALYPLAFFACYTLVANKKYTLKNAFRDSALFMLACVLISLLFVFFSADGAQATLTYLQSQVFNSVQGKDRVGERWPFISGFFQQNLHSLILVSLVLLVAKIKKQRIHFSPHTLTFLLCGLSAFVPLLISPKLSFYYLVPSIPCFALFFSLLIAQPLEDLFLKTRVPVFVFRSASIVFVLSIFIVVGFAWSKSGTSSRDVQLIADTEKIAAYVGAHQTLDITPMLYEDWTLIACMQRYGKLSVEKNTLQQTFMLIKKDETIPTGYLLSKLSLSELQLIEQNKNTLKP